MNKVLLSIILISAMVIGLQSDVFAGNPDRQGEAGAYELLMFPWARTAGLSGMNTADIRGAEALRLNIAGASRVTKTELAVGHMRYLDGSGISMNGVSLAQKMGSNGAFAVSMVALDFGDIPVTTTENPEGTGGTFSPAWFHIGIGYSHTFDNKVSVGVLVRGIFEATAETSASAFALDAGVQYVAGADDQFRVGIALRNVGSRMKFGGEAFTDRFQRDLNNDPNSDLALTLRTASFELPSVLNLGVSYDLVRRKGRTESVPEGQTKPDERHRLTAYGNFTANSFSRDQAGLGLEYAFRERFMLRGGYKLEYDTRSEDIGGREIGESIYSGLSLGATVTVDLNRRNPDQQISIDYAYRNTDILNGTHNFGVRLNL